jgi:hypothetical protein
MYIIQYDIIVTSPEFVSFEGKKKAIPVTGPEGS